MTADVNVTEKVARAIGEAGLLGSRQAKEHYATAALSALADPDVQAGIAGVVEEHGPDTPSYDAGYLDGCRGRDCVDWRPPSDGDPWRAHAEHVAAAVVERLTGKRQ